MLFNSYIFVFLFLPFVFIFYFYLSATQKKLAKFFLIVSSLFFYSWWNPIYLPLILISMGFNYTLGKSLAKGAVLSKISKKQLLVLGISVNIGLLGYFKYYDFFITNVNTLLGTQLSLLHLALPLAISFFTFQQIAYLVDSYRGETTEYNWLNYALFVSFFPQLIAGPIVHHGEMMPQFSDPKNMRINYTNIATGLFVFSIGLFKKVIIADTFAVWANNGFDGTAILNFIESWVTSLSYTFQLYFDFSGYTDMAIGISLLFNIRLPINFNSPYKSANIQEFWRRWHITLSRFLRDYIYIPLGGNQSSSFKIGLNLMLTFLIGGLWHGAGWTFIFWGFLNGLALILHRLWSRSGFRMPTFLGWIITFNFVNIGWVFFRAREWGDAIKILKGMLGLTIIELPTILANKLIFLSQYGIQFGHYLVHVANHPSVFLWILGGFILTISFENSTKKMDSFKPNFTTAIYSVLLFLYSAFSLNKISGFLYFNF